MALNAGREASTGSWILKGRGKLVRAKEVLSSGRAQQRGIVVALYCQDYRSRKGFVRSVLYLEPT